MRPAVRPGTMVHRQPDDPAPLAKKQRAEEKTTALEHRQPQGHRTSRRSGPSSRCHVDRLAEHLLAENDPPIRLMTRSTRRPPRLFRQPSAASWLRKTAYYMPFGRPGRSEGRATRASPPSQPDAAWKPAAVAADFRPTLDTQRERTKLGVGTRPSANQDCPVSRRSIHRRRSRSRTRPAGGPSLRLAARRAEGRRDLGDQLRQSTPPQCRNSDARKERTGRTDTAIARAVGLGGKDLYRQARAVWRIARTGDPRARSSVVGLDAGTKTIHAAYKDLRRRDRFTAGFRPTPYDVWPFRHDRAFGIPHPGAIPPAIVAHVLHYYTTPDALVVDPMAGGGTTLDVCESMGRRCLAYDLHPVRPEIAKHDVRDGFPREASECDLIFCDPPIRRCRRAMVQARGASHCRSAPPSLDRLPRVNPTRPRRLATLRPPGVFRRLLLANQTEKDPPAARRLYRITPTLAINACSAAGLLARSAADWGCSHGRASHLPQHVQRSRRRPHAWVRSAT